MNYLQKTFGLEGKKAIVTGASKGIGKGIAMALASSGAEVLVHYNSGEEAAKEVVGVIEKEGGKAWSLGADLTNSRQVGKFYDRVKEKWSSLDILVNNAGDLVRRSSIEEMPDELFDQVMQVNVYTTFYASRGAIPLLKKGSQATVINISSIAARNGGGPSGAPYATAKAAVHNFTRGLAKELAPEIRVNGISPGVIFTDFQKKHSTEEGLKNMISGKLLKRGGTIEEMGAIAVFLASNASSFLTGEMIEANGGMYFS